jgi:hypothetical protein
VGGLWRCGKSVQGWGAEDATMEGETAFWVEEEDMRARRV